MRRINHQFNYTLKNIDYHCILLLLIIINLQQNQIIVNMRNLILVNFRFSSNMISQNKIFIDKVKKYRKQVNLHHTVGKIKQQQVENYIGSQSKQAIASKIAENSTYDQELRNFIKKFNEKHKGNVTLLDFSNYATSFGQMKNQPLRKGDLEMLQEFQKRKAQKQMQQIRKQFDLKNMIKDFDGSSKRRKSLKFYKKFLKMTGQEQAKVQKKNDAAQAQIYGGVQTTDQAISEMGDIPTSGPFQIKDDFIVLLLHRGVTTKITTLNRINSFRVLLFMGNGNGIISHAKGKDANYQDAMNKAIRNLQRNLIVIPRDSRCTLPLPITTKFQCYKLYLRPLPSYNSWGYPNISMMITLAGMDHCGFNVFNAGNNIYDAVHVVFKALTKNTTPQQLAQRDGFKVYRHQFIRPLTYVQTHNIISS